jgi:hypothetical protein
VLKLSGLNGIDANLPYLSKYNEKTTKSMAYSSPKSVAKSIGFDFAQPAIMKRWLSEVEATHISLGLLYLTFAPCDSFAKA